MKSLCPSLRLSGKSRRLGTHAPSRARGEQADYQVEDCLRKSMRGRVRTQALPCALLLLCVLFAIEFTTLGQPRLPAKFPLPSNPIELTRTARPNVYFDAVGRKAAILGKQSGTFEAWAFPMKLFHDARFSVLVEGQDAPVEFAANVERVIVRPEATQIIASNQLFTLRATFFAPIDEAGAIILLDVDTARPLTLTVSFVPDLKPMWPAGLGGQSAGWRDDLKAFVISESRRKYNALFGCPAAVRGVGTPAHQLAEGALRFDIKVDPATARQSYYPLIIAGGTNGRQPVVDLYQRLAASIPEQFQKTFEHYRRLRETMMSIDTPEPRFNLAFEWAKAALDKGMIDNPELGLGLVAGWGAAGAGARPGFGWFFGGDAAINSYAMTGYGDFESMAAAFRFLAKYQRADGKIPHEVAQSAAMIKWFEEYPYAYYHAETTPFFIAAVGNLYRQSGDRKLLEELWPALKKAYQFCIDNDTDGDGILENSKAGLGASELGSLLADLHQDIYLAATNLEASSVMRELAAAMNDPTLRLLAEQKYERACAAINERYWNATANRYAYALVKGGKQNTETTAWTAAPLMFGQLDAKRAGETLSDLASSQLSTDWGVRMLSARSAAYDPIAYNNGGVWPFLTGFVACAEYEYRRPLAALVHLRQLAQMAFDHAPGSHPEILSGDFYRPLDESVPHQLFSDGMVVTPLVRGLLGLRADAANHRLRVAPQLPAAWDRLRVKHYRLGVHQVSFEINRLNATTLRYQFTKEDDAPLKIELASVLPALARLARVAIDSRTVRLAPDACAGEPAQTTCKLEFDLKRQATVEISFSGGVELDVPFRPVELGARSSSLKVLDVNASASRLVLRVEGRPGQTYPIRLRGSQVESVQGGVRVGDEGGWQVIDIAFPAGGNAYERRDIEVRLKETGRR